MKTFFKTHRIAIFLAALVGIITGLPYVLAPLALESAYHGIPFLPLSDEYHYLARIREILDGHWSGTSTFLYEYKSMPSAMWPVNEVFYAIPALVFGIIPVVIASKFVLPAALFFLSYILLRYFFGKDDATSEVTAIAGGLFIALGAEFVNYAYLMRIPVLWLFTESLWTRLVNPIVGAVQLSGLLILLWMIWDRKGRYAYIAAGVLLASTIGYFFTFGLSLAILASLFACALARREFDIAKKFFLVGTISIVIDGPWWYAMLTTLGGEAGRIVATQNGMSFTHAPVLNKAVFVSSILFGLLFCYTYFYLKDRSRIREWLFAASLLVGSWIAFNQQVITGREVWYHHFVQYTVPICVIALICGAYLTLHRYRKIWNFSMYALCIVMLTYGFSSITSYTIQGDLRYLVHIQPRASFLAWLDTHATKDCVVLVNANNKDHEEEERFIPAFSGCNTYVTDDPLLSMTAERAEFNFLLRLQMMNMDPARVRDYLLTQEADVRGNFYSDFAEAFGKGMDPWILEKIDALTKEYKEFIKTDLETHIKKYRVDYILSEGLLSPKLLEVLPDVERAASVGTYDIYYFRKDMQ